MSMDDWAERDRNADVNDNSLTCEECGFSGDMDEYIFVFTDDDKVLCESCSDIEACVLCKGWYRQGDMYEHNFEWYCDDCSSEIDRGD